MAPPSVVAFTDTYHPTVNGVTYTVASWRECWQGRGGRMDVVYPDGDGYEPDAGEHPVPSVPFPYYDGFRLGLPRLPRAVRDGAVDVVHAHTPFSLGIDALRLARRTGAPVVANYHTPTGEYADYLADREWVERAIAGASKRYERWFFGRVDAVVAPSDATRRYLEESVRPGTPVEVVPNGVDLDRFRPVDPTDFRARYGLDGDRPLVGYTGRHGYEKRLADLIEAGAHLDARLVLGGDGPARADLEARARDLGVDARFLGFLDRDDLPALYSVLDAFVLPSPVETQGLVALEANACGTPVVGADEGALADTVEEGRTGYRYETGNVPELCAAVERVLSERDRLSEACLAGREEIGMERAVDRLAEVYRGL
ncbi:MAG: glycosyltransferase [Haloferacaceae archaeon]